MRIFTKYSKMAIRKSLKDRLIFIVYNLTILLVFIGLSEALLAYWISSPSKIPTVILPAFRAYYTEHLRSAIQMEPNCAQYDQELFYTLKPGTCSFTNAEYNTTVRVNSLGIRDDEESLKSPEVVLLGDSFTMGWGVEQDSTFESHLERNLGTKVLNAGISSYGTVRELKLLKRLPTNRLKTLVIQYHDSDLIENREFSKATDSLIISSEEKYRQTSEMVRNRIGYYFGKHTSLMTKFILKQQLGRLGDRKPTDHEDVQYFLNAFTKLPIVDTVNVIIFEASSYGNPHNKFIEALEKELKSNSFKTPLKIRTLNVQPALSSDDFYVLDDHLNASGHRKIAKLLAQVIEELN
jgi:hypothetical protein